VLDIGSRGENLSEMRGIVQINIRRKAEACGQRVEPDERDEKSKPLFCRSLLFLDPSLLKSLLVSRL
jgi:hypothetical protein